MHLSEREHKLLAIAIIWREMWRDMTLLLEIPDAKEEDMEQHALEIHPDIPFPCDEEDLIEAARIADLIY